MSIREQLEQMALAYRKADKPVGEGEYGCPGTECPGVQRLTAFADTVARVTLDTLGQAAREVLRGHGDPFGIALDTLRASLTAPVAIGAQGGSQEPDVQGSCTAIEPPTAADRNDQEGAKSR